jgi:hypothetical protein
MKVITTKRHWNIRMNFAITHYHWTVEDWKRVVWIWYGLVRLKSTDLGQMERNGCERRLQRA